MMAASSKEVEVEMEEKEISDYFLELFLCHSLYLTAYQMGIQKYLMKTVVTHHVFIEQRDTVLVIKLLVWWGKWTHKNSYDIM